MHTPEQSGANRGVAMSQTGAEDMSAQPIHTEETPADVMARLHAAVEAADAAKHGAHILRKQLANASRTPRWVTLWRP